MLGKLLKYDFRALSRVMIPLQLSVLVAGVFGCFLINFAIRGLYSNFSSNMYSSRYYALQSILEGTSTLMGVLILGLVFASAWVTLFLIARHLYKSFMSDEGYLAFTLPVSTSQHLISKVICGTVWLLINSLILVAVVIVFSLVGVTTEGIINVDAMRAYGEVFRELANVQGIVFITELIILCLIGMLWNVLQIYMSIIVGGALARTHKVLAAVGIYFASSMVIQTLMSVVSFTLLFNQGSSYPSIAGEYSWVLAMQPFMIMALVISAILVVVFYFISHRVLESKLNLD